MLSSRTPVTTRGRLRRLSRGALVWWLTLLLPVQGVAMALERARPPAHYHVPTATGQIAPHTHDHAHSHPHAHADDGGHGLHHDHHHGFATPGVVYTNTNSGDSDGDGDRSERRGKRLFAGMDSLEPPAIEQAHCRRVAVVPTTAPARLHTRAVAPLDRPPR